MTGFTENAGCSDLSDTKMFSGWSKMMMPAEDLCANDINKVTAHECQG